MKEKNFVSVVVYVHNQEYKIIEFLKNLNSFLSDNFENFEIILVNDCSFDRTMELIYENKNLFSDNIIVLNMAWKHKLELAMLAGTEITMGDFIFEIDTINIDYPIEMIMDLFKKSVNGFDVVSAVPKNKQKLTSTIFYKMLNKVSYLNLDLSTENVRVISRRALNRVLILKEKNRYRKALYRYSGFPFFSFYYNPIISDRINEMRLMDKLSLSIDILFSFSNIGLKISLLLSLVFFFISVLLGFYALIVYFYLPDVKAGWTTTILFLSFGFSGIFFVLGIIGKYVSMILSEVQKRPNYIIKEVNKLK